ncbi:hypothetical protein [Methanolobus sp. WCC4]|uniref:hypothetical protein n=1 Tax=Methanolobus sp. WCC4 TaxID=3125784 RepID=UPI0030FA0EF0
MEYTKLFRESLNITLNNLPAYGMAALILTFGSIFTITAPSLLYGFVSMLVKGARQETVRTADIFSGFHSGNFVRGWVYFLFMLAVIVVLMLIWVILFVFAGVIMVLAGPLTGQVLTETMVVALIMVVAIVLACVAAVPAILVIYVLPLFVIRKYAITEAISESIQVVKDNFIASTIVCTIIALVALAGVVPYYAGFFLQWPQWLSLSGYIAGIVLTTPLSQQILVNTTFELMDE